MKKNRSANVTYEVGYGKAPIDTRFQKGQSGNPSGRRKKPASMPEVLQEELNQTITITRNGKRHTTTKMQAAVAGLVNTAIAGDMSAFRVLSVFVQALSASPSVSDTELEELDQKVLASLFSKFNPESDN